MLMEGFFAVTDVLEPHRLFLPAALPGSGSPAPPSAVAGGVLLPEGGVSGRYGVFMWKTMFTGRRRNRREALFKVWRKLQGGQDGQSKISWLVHKKNNSWKCNPERLPGLLWKSG